MKRTLIFFFASVGIFLVLIIANTQFGTHHSKRFHQHLDYHARVKTDPVSDFNTHLPIISIDTMGNTLPDDFRNNDEILTTVSIYDTAEDRNNYLTDQPAETSLCQLRIRGHSSHHFDKKSYLLQFVENDGQDHDLAFLGMASHHEWVLHGPFLDKTLIRNYMWYNIAGEIMDYAPNVRFVEMFYNGAYQGVYVATDSIAVDAERIDIKESKPEDVMTSFIIRMDRGSRNEQKNLDTFSKYTMIVSGTNCADMVYPKNPEAIERQKPYVEKEVSGFERMLYSYDFKDYPQYVDVDSFVDYFIINEFTQNYDAGIYSTYLYRDLRGKYKLCVWDFNNACDNYIEHTTKEDDFLLNDTLWFEMLLKDPVFTEKVISRYRNLRKGVLSEAYLMQYIDDTVAFLGDAKDWNFDVWGYSFDPTKDLLKGDRKIGSYEEAVLQLKEFVKDRGDYLDRNIEDLRQFSHESVNKEYLP